VVERPEAAAWPGDEQPVPALRVAAYAVVAVDGRVLLTQMSENTPIPGQWALPGGGLDHGETPIDAVVREVHEETGLLVRPERLAGVVGPHHVVYPNSDVVEVTSSAFVCSVVGGRLEPLDGESSELRFVALDEMPASPFLSVYPLAELVRGTGSAWFAWDESWLSAP
jgi:ADP-ribose pyrophosphatase YjhB (NUDIX family)